MEFVIKDNPQEMLEGSYNSESLTLWIDNDKTEMRGVTLNRDEARKLQNILDVFLHEL